MRTFNEVRMHFWHDMTSYGEVVKMDEWDEDSYSDESDDLDQDDSDHDY